MIGDIVGVGARGPVGLSSLQLAMGVRARKLEPRTLPVLRDKRGQDIGACVTGGISLAVIGYERLLALAAPAAIEALLEVRVALGLDAAGEASLPVLVSLPEPGRADDDARFGAEFLAALAKRAGFRVAQDKSAVVRTGRAGLVEALQQAARLLDDGEPAVLVGGVDSWCAPAVLAELDAASRLHALGAEEGVIPSEGAGFVLIVRQQNSRRKVPPPRALAHIVFAETAVEEGGTPGGSPNVAAAMTALVRSALGIRRPELRGPEAWLLSDLNGERHRIEEWELVAVRNDLDVRVAHDRFLEHLGELGAASGAVLLALAVAFWRTGAAPCGRALLALHSDGPLRGTIAVEEVRA